jgi:hypothetical protein
MFELGRTIENIRINFNKLCKTLSDKVCKILTKLFKENNPPRKEKVMEVKRKKDFTYVEYIQYTFRNLKLLSDELLVQRETFQEKHPISVLLKRRKSNRPKNLPKARRKCN